MDALSPRNLLVYVLWAARLDAGTAWIITAAAPPPPPPCTTSIIITSNNNNRIRSFSPYSGRIDWKRRGVVHQAAIDDAGDDDEDDEEVEPGKMRVSEIKAELDLREVGYQDCFDKESLVERLNEARATGKASPTILEKFNRQKIEETFKGEKVKVDDMDQINAAVSNDGTLPGGMTPEQFQKLASNPEIMSLLQSTKMQEAMTLMMTGGREELDKKLQEDPELQETVTKLNEILTSL